MSLLLDSDVSLSTHSASITMLSGLEQVTSIPSTVYNSNGALDSSYVIKLTNGTSTAEYSSSTSMITQSTSSSGSGAEIVVDSRSKKYLLLGSLIFFTLGSGLISL